MLLIYIFFVSMDYLQDRGIVRSVKDSVVVVEGLKNVKLGEMVVITSTYLVGSQQTDGVIKVLY